RPCEAAEGDVRERGAMHGIDVVGRRLVRPRSPGKNHDFIEMALQFLHDEAMMQAGRIEAAAEKRDGAGHAAQQCPKPPGNACRKYENRAPGPVLRLCSPPAHLAARFHGRMRTLKTFTNVAEAGFAHSLLEAAGLHPFLANEQVGALYSPGIMSEGIRLQV